MELVPTYAWESREGTQQVCMMGKHRKEQQPTKADEKLLCCLTALAGDGGLSTV